jgi:hypothetical protein
VNDPTKLASKKAVISSNPEIFANMLHSFLNREVESFLRFGIIEIIINRPVGKA